jgi:hypothetical protein
MADNASYPNAKFVLLNYASPDHLDNYLSGNQMDAIESGKLVVYKTPEPGPFKMAHAKNMAHRLGIMEGGDILVNLDADNYTGPGFARYLAEKFQEAGEHEIFLWSRMISDGPDRLPRGINGRIAVTREAFLNAGGYDEQYATWSPDDKDFNLRLRRLGYTAQEIDRKYLDAILHNDKMRFKEYRHVSTHHGEDQLETIGDSDATIANYGKIGMGTVYKNFSTEPMQVESIPTRIFGIGLHKTATTSLHYALNILGYQSAHWKSAHWAKTIWEEMLAYGRSVMLERSYALSDLPIPLLYEKLDKAYPGSKFILTIRNEYAWLRSVRKHWSPQNKFRSAWDTDPFTHKIHKALYGQKGFDEAIFLERYRRHNAEVMHYFRDRPWDLLVMDMQSGAGWRELCGFLRKPIPMVEYPREYVSA